MVIMEHLPYIAPSVRVIPVQFDGLLCAISASNGPYIDYGEYQWSDED